jgi:hypothetical protein
MAPNKDVYKKRTRRSQSNPRSSLPSRSLESPHLQHALSSDHRNNIQLGARPPFPPTSIKMYFVPLTLNVPYGPHLTHRDFTVRGIFQKRCPRERRGFPTKSELISVFKEVRASINICATSIKLRYKCLVFRLWQGTKFYTKINLLYRSIPPKDENVTSMQLMINQARRTHFYKDIILPKIALIKKKG